MHLTQVFQRGLGVRNAELRPTLQGRGWVVEGAAGDAAVRPSLLTGSCKGVPSEANLCLGNLRFGWRL